MSDLLKPFKHFDTYAHFLTKKISADSSNTTYRVNNGVLEAGTPDILWEHFVLIHDIGQIWNRGRFYNHQTSYATLAKIAKKTFEPYDGAIISFLEEDGRSYFLTGGIFDAFKSSNVIPSLSIVPKFIDDEQGENSDGSLYPVMSIDNLYSLINYGCDIINHSYSHDDTNIYNSSSSYETIVSDLKKAEQWFVSHSIFTNCFSYPFNAISENIRNAVSRFEEYGLIYNGVNFLNEYKTDNLSFVKINLSDSNIADVKVQIDLAITNKSWLIITTHSCGDASVDDLGSASIYGKLSSSTITNIINYINTKSGFRYYTVSDALKVRASELNVNGFKIYKDGDIAFNEKAKDTIMTTVAENLTEYAMITLDGDEIGGKYITTENYEKIYVGGLGSFTIGEHTLVFDKTDDTNWKAPMLSYIQSNIDYDSTNQAFKDSVSVSMNFDKLTPEFKLKMLQYVISNWNTETGEYSILADKNN